MLREVRCSFPGAANFVWRDNWNILLLFAMFVVLIGRFLIYVNLCKERRSSPGGPVGFRVFNRQSQRFLPMSKNMQISLLDLGWAS